MKNTKHLILTLFLCLSISKIFSQEINTNQTSKKDTSENIIYVDKVKYLKTAFKKETTLLKVAISPLKFTANKNSFAIKSFSGHVDFEQKISIPFSILIANKATYFSSNEDYLSWQYTTSASLRYYYSMKKNIRESVGANNFHSNYISVGLSEIVRYRKLNESNLDFYDQFLNEQADTWAYKPALFISWGIQRRFSNWLFIDINPYIEFESGIKGLGVNLLFGLALGK